MIDRETDDNEESDTLAPSEDDQEDEGEDDQEDEDQLEPLRDLTDTWTVTRVSLLGYQLPQGVTLTTEAPMSHISKLLGIAPGLLGKAFKLYGQFTYHPATPDQPQTAKNIAVWQALSLREMKLLTEAPRNVRKVK